MTEARPADTSDPSITENGGFKHLELLGLANGSPWRGKIPNAIHGACAANSLCGDEISLELRLSDGIIAEIRFQGCGCFVSQGAATLLCRNVNGKAVEADLELSDDDLLGFRVSSLALHRQDCARLACRTFRKALGIRTHDPSGLRHGHRRLQGTQPEPVGYSRRSQSSPSHQPIINFDPLDCEGQESGRIHAGRLHRGIPLRGTIRKADPVAIHEIFDAVYCINLNRRPDRWEQFLKQVPEEWPFREIQRVGAIDGQRVPPPTWWRAGAGAWGCFRSHLALIEQALNCGLNSILLLEDDAYFHPDFTVRVVEFLKALPRDWGMIYLGGQHLHLDHAPPVKVNEFVYRPFNVNRTHAFGLRGDTMRKVYQYLCQNDWRKGHHIDHHLGMMHQTRQEPVYCPADWLVGQDEGKSNISGRQAPRRIWTSAEKLVTVDLERGPFVAVLGLHSSGSSCLAGVLYHLGLHLGNQLTGYYGNDPANNRCGFEAAGLSKICESAIPFPSVELKESQFDVARNLHTWIHEKRREAVGWKTIAAGKYPQLCQLGKFLLKICGDELRVITSERPLESSLCSLIRRFPRHQPEILERHQRWLQEGKQWLLDQLPADRKLIVHYENLLRDPDAEIDRLGRFLGIEPTSAQRVAIRHWVDPAKQHVKSATVHSSD